MHIRVFDFLFPTFLGPIRLMVCAVAAAADADADLL
jgi:hypothetical protein